MFAALHVGAYTRSGTQFSGKINVVTQASALAVAPITIATIVNVTEWNGEHERAVLQETRLGVLNEPHLGVKIIYNLLAPQNQGVRPNQISGSFGTTSGARVMGATGTRPHGIKVTRRVYGIVPCQNILVNGCVCFWV